MVDLGPLVNPPLDEPPRIDELRARVRRLRRRAGAGGAAAVAVAVIGWGALSLGSSGGHTTVRTAAPPSTSTSPAPPPTPPRPVFTGRSVLAPFTVNGQVWNVVARAGDTQAVCIELESGSELVPVGCWNDPAQTVEAAVADGPGFWYVAGVASADVTDVDVGYQPAPKEKTSPFLLDIGLPMKIFGTVLPADSGSVVVTATTTTGGHDTLTPPVPVHKRVASINGQPAPPDPVASDQPGLSVSAVHGSTGPAGTPAGTQPVPVTTVSGATGLHRQRFESALPAGPQAVMVLFWGGVAPCDVLGRVDVAYSATTVTITLWSGTAPGAEAVACPQLAQYKEVRVPLDSPLGDRQVVDGAA